MATLKISRVRVSVHLLESLFKGDWSRLCTRTTAPDDLQVVGVEQPPYGIGQWFYALVQSQSFQPVPEGAELPEIEPFEFQSEPVKQGDQP